MFDAYWFIDFQDINNSSANDTHDSDAHYYAEARIRLSLDALLQRDLSVGRLSEWFLAYELDLNDDLYGGGLRRHHVGVGTEIALDGVDYFQINLFARHVDEDYDNPSENSWDGYMLNVNFGGTLADLGHGMKLYLSGWLDWNFGAQDSRSKSDYFGRRIGSAYSLQWYNQIKLLFGDLGISYAYKLNRHFAETSPKPGNAVDSGAHIPGISYQFSL